MKLTFISNACQIIESKGFRLLCDPWLSPTAFYGAWEHDPPIETKPQDVLDVDAIYISHIHEDHADPNTLKHFRKDIPIVALSDKHMFCPKHLAKMGFTNIVALENKEQRTMGPFELTMFSPFEKHPYHVCEIGNVVDSALLIEADGVSILNTNDNLPGIESAKWLAEEYGPITMLQINYNNASCYPAAFRNLTKEEKISEHHKAINRNLFHMVAVAKAMQPKYVMPFAGAYKLGGKLAHLNEYLGTTTYANACDYLTDHKVQAVYMEENDVFHVI